MNNIDEQKRLNAYLGHEFCELLGIDTEKVKGWEFEENRFLYDFRIRGNLLFESWDAKDNETQEKIKKNICDKFLNIMDFDFKKNVFDIRKVDILVYTNSVLISFSKQKRG